MRGVRSRVKAPFRLIKVVCYLIVSYRPDKPCLVIGAGEHLGAWYWPSPWQCAAIASLLAPGH